MTWRRRRSAAPTALIGLVLYDADRVLTAASTPDDHDLYEAQRKVFLDPHDPAVVREAERAGIPRDWIQAAQRSPVYPLINDYQVALPLHPEYRTLPMVWYIPPLSPVVDIVRDTGPDGEDAATCSPRSTRCASRSSTWPQLFTAGDPAPVRACCGGWPRCARTCARSTSAATPTSRSPPRWG